ncbi:MAG: YicC/YloC family endoribonuclease [Thermodesulfobacteriota bacterium]|nr:YicC/YloC family endoribonuclease [Thermodesulfobacteriota bacterium]
MKYPLSMTSFGRGECRTGDRTWTVEIRSVNHRYRDINVKMPRSLGAIDDRIKKEISTIHSRGKIDVMINPVDEGSAKVSLRSDLQLAREYYRCLKEISQELGIENFADLSLISSFKDVITSVDKEEDLDEIWGAIREALKSALAEALHMREAEGKVLKNDLVSRLDTISTTTAGIEESIPELVKKKQAVLKERLDNLLDGVDIDPVRLAQETAIIADKSDITEELVRLQSHVMQFSRFLELKEPVGRRLDFLLQEFNREVNTMASKIGNSEATHLTVDLKNEVEKMREQVQNLE